MSSIRDFAAFVFRELRASFLVQSILPTRQELHALLKQVLTFLDFAASLSHEFTSTVLAKSMLPTHKELFNMSVIHP